MIWSEISSDTHTETTSNRDDIMSAIDMSSGLPTERSGGYTDRGYNLDSPTSRHRIQEVMPRIVASNPSLNLHLKL